MVTEAVQSFSVRSLIKLGGGWMWLCKASPLVTVTHVAGIATARLIGDANARWHSVQWQ
jgi:hypothetical protein